MKRYNKWTIVATSLALILGVTSCRKDFLDRTPESSISPAQYLTYENHLAEYTITNYGAVFDTNNGGYNIGAASWDDNTDNESSNDGNSSRYVVGNRKTTNTGDLGFSVIRDCNYFIHDVEAKLVAGKITGDKANINHYLGEMYVIRALAYYQKLTTYGDFPIVLDVLPDDEAEILKVATRQPSTEVARQILKDLDKAISLLKDQMANKNRITKLAAKLLKARVALFEGTFLKYHRGTGRVPGDTGWPGAKVHSGKTFDIDSEITYFLTTARDAAKEVADAVPSLTPNSGVYEPTQEQIANWNPYYDMFSSADPSSFPEVLLWRKYDTKFNIAHRLGSIMRTGGNVGYTKAFVESFLMEDGRPWYAASSAKPFAGDDLLSKVKTNRDGRLRLFLFDENSPIRVSTSTKELFNAPSMNRSAGSTDATGYRPRKYMSYDESIDQPGTHDSSTSAFVVLRASEAYLIYIESSYLLENSLNATARELWEKLRIRAGIQANTIDATIANTDMEREKGDWGSYSGGVQIDKTLYNIRRERRNEFIAEGRRWEDLVRWRSLDQVKNYFVEGINFWQRIAQSSKYPANFFKASEGASWNATHTAIIPPATINKEANISPRSLGNYILPLLINLSGENSFLNGYNTDKGVYQAPISIRELELASPDHSLANSRMYQTAYWATTPDTPAKDTP